MMQYVIKILICLCLSSASTIVGSITYVLYSEPDLEPGNQFHFTCHAQGFSSQAVVEIYKQNYTVWNYHGYSLFLDKALPITNGSFLPEELGNRYTLTKNPWPIDGGFKISVSDIKPEDGGLWICKVLDNGLVYTSSLVFVNVIGPIQGVHLATKNILTSEVTRQEDNLTLVENQTDNAILCEVYMTNSLPTTSIYLEDTDGVRTNITDTCEIQWSLSYSVENGGLVRTEQTLRFTRKASLASLENHGKKLICEASLRRSRLSSMAKLNIVFSPRDIDCPDFVLTSVGSTLVKITCRVRANPQVTVTWRLPDGTAADNPKNYDACLVQEETSSMLTETSLVIKSVTSQTSGTYIFSAYNEYGDVTQEINIKSLGASPTPPSISASTEGASCRHLISSYLILLLMVLQFAHN